MGEWWHNITNHEGKGECVECGCIETLDHMLTECKSSGQHVIWPLARMLWSQTDLPWPGANLGTILGCGLAQYNNKKGKPDAAKRRLFKILMSESAYLIWKIRCDWRIQRKGDPSLKITDHEIVNRWRKTLSSRIHMDIACTNEAQLDTKALKLATVQKTWGDLIRTKNIRGLSPEDITRFLVGMQQKTWQPP